MTKRAPETFDATFHTTTGSVTFRAWRSLSPHGADRLHNLVRLGYYDGSPLYRVLPGFVAQFGVAAQPSLAAVYNWRNDHPGAIIPDEATVLRRQGEHLVGGEGAAAAAGGVGGGEWGMGEGGSNSNDVGEGGGGGGGSVSNAKHWLAYSASYGAAGVATNRTAELFVNLVDNSRRLDGKGFAAFARVVAGEAAMDRWYAGYGEMDGACQLHRDGGWVCDGPNEDKLYARGLQYVDAEFPRMDRIAWAEAGGETSGRRDVAHLLSHTQSPHFCHEPVFQHSSASSLGSPPPPPTPAFQKIHVFINLSRIHLKLSTRWIENAFVRTRVCVNEWTVDQMRV